MSEIKPALTPEEWAEGVTSGGACFAYVEGDLWLHGPDKERDIVLIQNRHAAAALCLHGQPFGFTWEMCWAARAAANLARAHEDKSDDYTIQAKSISYGPGKFGELVELTVGDLRQLALVADRIAALLPPEESRG